MITAFLLRYFRTPPYLMSLQCLSTPTEFPGTLPLSIDYLLGPRLCLVEDAFILGPLSWAIMTKTNLFIHQHSLFWRRLLLFRQTLILGLGHRPNIQIDYELLGSRALQKQFKFKKFIYNIPNKNLPFLGLKDIGCNALIFLQKIEMLHLPYTI